jgi:hypothetical protein
VKLSVRLTVWNNSKANRWGAVYLPKRLMNKYEQDKKNMDYIADKIAHKEPLKEWVAFYWMAVAIGHILEWIVKHGKEFKNS